MLFEAILTALALFFLWKCLKKPAEYPPGRWGLPYLGYLPFTRKSLSQQVLDLQKEHGEIVTWRIGTQVAIFLYDFKVIKECMNRDEFSDRPNFLFIKFIDRGNVGLVGSNELPWVNNRRFTLRQLRDLGMGKSKLVFAVQNEAHLFVEELKKYAGKPTKLPHELTIAVLNVIWQMVSGKRYDLYDPKATRMTDMMESIQTSLDQISMVDFFPWLKNILPKFLFAKIMKTDLVDRVIYNFRQFFSEAIDECASSQEENGNNFISAYLAEMERQKGDPTCTKSKEDLIASIFDLFGAGSETVTKTLDWAIFYLANHQDVQKKLQEEIDRVLPKGTLASLEDKPRLPYTDCFIHELMRHVSLVIIGVMHCARNDTIVSGYKIPKGAIILPVNGHVHYNPKYWKDPEEFRPERHLDEEGKFVHPKEGFIPFGIGKRQCVGESLARMELFIFLTSLVQSFTFSPPPGKKMDLSAFSGSSIIRLPKEDQEVIFTIR